ncbi:SusC/RagA family TonB-linked outer membrane protein [Niabella sp. CJ426]|uniref:SusC/RagA family TonB-linked outer membrane protein n=1 Tax=Niabella sp. CJ426 TaxID=3393740 RepID=UPI003D03B7F9
MSGTNLTTTQFTGKVVDQIGNPVSNTYIYNNRTKVATRSDSKGMFTIDANIGDSLFITHTRYQNFQYIILDVSKSLVIELIPRIDVEEEVIVSSGYQKISRARTTGAFNKVDSALLQQQVSPNILDRLKNVSNVYFDTKNLGSRSTNITIRGLSTINGNMSPLIVVDNFPYNGDISDINPDDVESITILKDATAASIWGAKSANGVVVITTKKGRYNQPVSIEINTTISLSNTPDFRRSYDISIEDYIDVERYLFNNNYGLSDTSSIDRLPFTPVYEMLLARKKGLINTQDSASFVNNLLTTNQEKEYVNTFYQQANTQQYNLSLRGGGKNYNWFISGAYNHITAPLKLNNSNKKNLRIENTFSPAKGLELGLRLFYTQQISSVSPTPDYGSITIGSKRVPYLLFSDADGNALSVDRYYRGSYLDTVGKGRLLDWKYYPMEDYTHNKTTNTVQNLLLGLNINYSFLKNFNLGFNYQQEQQQRDYKETHTIQSFYTRDLINQFTSFSSPTAPLTHAIPVGDILIQTEQKMLSRYGRLQLSYRKTVERFSYTGLVGAEINERKLYDGNNSTFYGFIEDPLSFATLNFNQRYPTYVNGTQKVIPGAPKYFASTNNRFVSGFMNNEIIWDKKYIANLSLRTDASNIFGLTTNDKWNPFWSAGSSWVISREKFFQLKSVSLLKLRTTVGVGGNVDPTRTALPTGGSATNSTTNFYYATIRQLNNPSLRWEKSRQINLAFDFEVFQRVSGSIDWYFKEGTDLYGPALLDYTAWGRSNTVVKNVASMKGKGLEISLQTKNIIRPFLWTSNIVFNYNESKTSDYFDPNAENIYSFILSGGGITPVIGKPLYAIAAYKWGGLDDKGDPQGFIKGAVSKDYPKIRESAFNGDQSGIVYLGQADPKIFGSLSNNFSYKGWFLSANISYKLGHYFKRPSLNYNTLYRSGIGNSEYANRWQTAGDETRTNVPARVYTNYPNFSGRDEFYNNSEINYLKADHVRLEYINIGYSFPFLARQKSLPRNLSLIVNITNLGIIWRSNKENLDPDYYYSYTPPQQFSMTLKLGL